MSVLILARHGNTFEKGQTPVRVGARTNMPLTQEGEAQGRTLAEHLAAHYFPLGGIVAAPLLRTKRFAEIIAQKANNVFTLDERLTEIDYGLWEGKTDDQIKALYGAADLEKWEKDGLWPEGMNWAPSREKVERNVRLFLEEQHKKLIAPGALSRMAVTSNGILRFFYLALTGRVDPEAKVKTGRFCVLNPTADGWTVDTWNAAP